MSLFTSGGGKAAKFPTIGTSISGKIAQMPFEKQATVFGTNTPATWPNGDPKMDVVVPLESTNVPREDANDDGDRTIYVSSGKMKKAIGEAIQAAGVTDVAIGGLLTITYVSNDPNSQNPANPAKLYQAQYTPPTTGLAAPAPAPAPAQVAPQQAYQQPPAAPAPAPPAPPQVPQPVAQPAPPAAPAPAPAPAPAAAAPGDFGPTLPAGVNQQQYDQAKQLLALGSLDHPAIGAALSLTAEQVAHIANGTF